MLYEYRDPADFKDMIQAERLSTADKLNGVEWRGMVIWSAAAYRTWEDGEGWSEWKSTDTDHIDPSQVLASLGSGTLAGNLVFFLEKKQGRWSIALGSVGLLGLSKQPIDPEEYWSSKVSCAAATSSDPFAAPAGAGAAQAPVTGPAGDQDYAKLVEDLIGENSKSWLLNRFIGGSVDNVVVEAKDSSGRPAKMQAGHAFDGLAGRTHGSVTITFTDGLPDCLYFLTFLPQAGPRATAWLRRTRRANIRNSAHCIRRFLFQKALPLNSPQVNAHLPRISSQLAPF